MICCVVVALEYGACIRRAVMLWVMAGVSVWLRARDRNHDVVTMTMHGHLMDLAIPLPYLNVSLAIDTLSSQLLQRDFVPYGNIISANHFYFYKILCIF